MLNRLDTLCNFPRFFARATLLKWYGAQATRQGFTDGQATPRIDLTLDRYLQAAAISLSSGPLHQIHGSAEAVRAGWGKHERLVQEH